jgi:uncharacterized protein YdiU (UPF0061 family)
VEEAISAAVNVGDFQPFESLLTVLSMPYEDQPVFGRYVDPPRSEKRALRPRTIPSQQQRLAWMIEGHAE